MQMTLMRKISIYNHWDEPWKLSHFCSVHTFKIHIFWLFGGPRTMSISLNDCWFRIGSNSMYLWLINFLNILTWKYNKSQKFLLKWLVKSYSKAPFTTALKNLSTLHFFGIGRLLVFFHIFLVFDQDKLQIL